LGAILPTRDPIQEAVMLAREAIRSVRCFLGGLHTLRGSYALTDRISRTWHCSRPDLLVVSSATVNHCRIVLGSTT